MLSLFCVQVRLVRELEKKFSGRPVVFVAQRRILPKPKRNQRTRQKQLRPRRYVFDSEIRGKGRGRVVAPNTSVRTTVCVMCTINMLLKII